MTPGNKELLELTEELADGRLTPLDYLDAVTQDDSAAVDVPKTEAGRGAKEANKARRRIDRL